MDLTLFLVKQELKKKMINIRSMYKTVTRLLFITLGTMWLSFAIAPCFQVSVEKVVQHNCCPETGIGDGKLLHINKQGTCDDCDMVQPALRSTDLIILSSAKADSDYQPVIIEWNYKKIQQLVAYSYRLSPDIYPVLPPPLRFRVLLI